MVAVGISGATGCIYGIRLLEALRALGQETELILSDWGAETIRLETDLTVEQVKALADRVYDNRNMETVTLMGGIILPPVPAFYSRPQTVDDIVDQTVSRTLRLLGLDGGERFRWNGNG